MHILPPEIIQLLENFRPLMRIEVFETFTLLVTGLLVGEAKHGTVRSEGHSAVSTGKPQTAFAHGTASSNIQLSQQKPLALTKCDCEERTGSR